MSSSEYSTDTVIHLEKIRCGSIAFLSEKTTLQQLNLTLHIHNDELYFYSLQE